MKERKLRVFLEIYFKPNVELEKRLKKSLTRPFRFEGSGQLFGPRPERDLEFVAKVPAERIRDLRRMAYAIRRFKGVKSASFSIVEEIPLTKGPLGLRRT
jgi:hypothetical protein